MADAPPEDLLKAIAEGRCLIVCGAGVSRLATDGKAPGWANLIKKGLEQAQPKTGKEPAWVRACREQLESDASTDDWLKAADTIQEKLGGRYRPFLKAAVGDLKATKRDIIDALRTLTTVGNPISTTSYDSVLCDGVGCRVVSWTNPDGAADCLDGDGKAILHLHGHWDEPGSVIFSARDYVRVKGAESAQFLQQLATHTRTLVFVGCSASGLSDENVGSLLRWFGTRWAGRGKKHYVLVRESELEVGWPDAVTAIVYGHDYAELPPFLTALAPTRALDTTPPSAERAPFPPDPNMIGRQDRLQEVVRFILEGDRPIIVPGGPGIGKTTLALAAAYDAGVKSRFGTARSFVDLQAITSAEAMLRALATELGVDVTVSSKGILAGLGGHAAKTPTLAILDNLETPWHAEPIRTEEMLGQLAGIAGLRFVLTVRGETPRVPGGGETLDDIERLKLEEAKALFLRESRSRFAADPALPALLAALDGHPLSIMLMAAQTDGRKDLGGLVEDWNRRRAAVLARGPANDRLTSVRVSLGLSLDRLADQPKRLLGLVAMLPAGLQEEDIAAILPIALIDVAAALVKARLVESRGGRLTMLAPLRETAREEKLATDEEKTRLIAHFLAIAADGDKIGTGAWPMVRERVTREAGNLDAICLLALEQTVADQTDLEQISRALLGLAELHRFCVPAEVTSLHHARTMKDTPNNSQLKALCVAWLGDIALRRSDLDTALALYEEATLLFELNGDPLGCANCIQGLGDIAFARSDHDTALVRYKEAKPLFERAGNLLGLANCTKSLGDIAFARSDHDTARARYEEARPLFERASDQLGRANCIRGLGDIALRCSDHETARARYEEANPLFEQVGSLLGQASCIQGLGDIALAYSDHDTARARYEGALVLYAKIPEPYSIGFAHLRLMQEANDATNRDRHREAARTAWASIGRQDLIADLLDPPKKRSPRMKRGKKRI